ncbi:ankyrin repeat and SOCS box protein 3-like [Asbolus verrucosus]|uniref:Ankyrin repeat and SOCS box protein 3-like n=1 Tax=Asbolus verrucosus TaxID=1661398 RepID=A0A482WED4_ASBVE|nr:ankyrin repeat and SOCS box protein 3-like [Asbolus verrucosus]
MNEFRYGRPPFRYGRSRRRESNPFFSAVLKNDLEQVKFLVESGKSVNTKNKLGNTLLNYVIAHQRVEIFDYLMSLDSVDVNCVDSFGRSPLLYSATESFDEYFALELLKKGADIHVADDAGFTFLHMAARCASDDHLTAGKLVIERGADINAQARFGVTPLYAACEEGNLNWIHMLLYYGASATIPSHNGILPVAVISSSIPYVQQIYLQEILLNHTFDEDKISVNLSTLVAAMALDSSLFLKLVDVASDVNHAMSDLKYFYSSLIHLKAKHFRLFVQKFGNIVKDMIENFAPLTMLVSLGVDLALPELKEILYIFLKSDYVAEFVQMSDSSYPIITNLVRMFNTPEMVVQEGEITNIVCLMLTYGLNVTSGDLDTVYCYYGHSELFKILLHMDIEMAEGKGTYGSVMAALYYNPNTEVEVCLDKFSLSSDLFSYYNHPTFKEYVLNKRLVDEKIAAKVKILPPVPSLVELSRNVTRKYIVNRYGIKNSMQFYTVLKWLPIAIDPLIYAILQNDLNEVKTLVESGKSVNEMGSFCKAPLHWVIKHQRVEIFNYLMGLDDIDIDTIDFQERSPLLRAAVSPGNEYFISELIKKGANVHLKNDKGFTFLHIGASSIRVDFLNLGRLVIEKGADVNAQNNYGETPLHLACRTGNIDWIYMLLYYGANTMITCNMGFLPLIVLSPQISQKERLHLEEILYHHTFDAYTETVRLSALVEVMGQNTDLFSKIVEMISDVSCSTFDLSYLHRSLLRLQGRHFKLFVNKFGNIVKEMIENFPVLITLVKRFPTLRFTNILYVLLESDYVSDLIQSSDLSHHLISKLIRRKFYDRSYEHTSNISVEEIANMIYALLSYGLNVSLHDLNVVYKYFGYCKLFKILLHMDFEMVGTAKKNSMAVLYYNPSTQIEVLCNKVSLSVELLSYYNHPKLKELCSEDLDEEEISNKAKNLPPVPFLVELSRNVARQYIMSKYKIKNSMQFYTIVNWLPICEAIKKIIILETKLY